MELHGRVWKFGDNIDTDLIIPARYLNVFDPLELAKHCMEDINPAFAQEIQPGDIIVAGKNFGCGSSREHAPLALKAAGVSAIIAPSFARIFYRNAFNIGLPIFEFPPATEKIRTGDEIVINMATGVITNLTQNEQYQTTLIPPFMQEIISAGGLINHIQKNKRKGK
ncbi:MAG TPA: 3-isopropylmalate dehydratase small subunit [Desulfotomaculum sp.]|nr:3-isopropylmalate dehydratase small subunit [Desulfotomaculum sp.]